MRRFIPIILLVTFAWPFNLQAQDNELHAFQLEHHGVYPVKNFFDNPLFVDQNISAESTPQNEPSVRISRKDPNVVVAAWRDFRLGWQEPNVIRRIGYSYSHDGGLTWSESQLLPDPNPDHLSQSDPVLTSDEAGNFYISSTSRQNVVNYNREMLLYKSTDNGVSFSLHAIAVPGSGSQGEDKEWIFCDPVPDNSTYDNIMIAWRSFGPDPRIKFAKSDVGGTNWGPSVPVGDGYWGQGANLATGTNGSIYVVWWDNGLKFDRSTDGGNSFGIDSYISSYGSQINTTFPFICVDYSQKASRGNVYVVWADRRNGTDDIWFQRSANHGDTWMSQPIMVNDIEQNQQYWPTIQCDDNGRIVVVFYDEREGAGIINAYLAYSDDQGNSWTNIRLSNESFNANTPNSNVRFGDYIHVDAYAGKIIPVWTDDRAGSFNQEIYSAVLDIPISVAEHKMINENFVLYQNYPNPFNNNTTIHFDLEKAMNIRGEIFNSAGQLVDIAFDGYMTEGEKQIIWNADQLPAGIYYLKIISGKDFAYMKMSIL
ncbi:MAG TPA: T9SS type A sorting domain-containing protein [Bacteroidales bacterium]|nr:T9SS type A sorting domain-containing protein [Bacteroidales bacterium]